jgi:tetratricopeptide (TPR) repeat protein
MNLLQGIQLYELILMILGFILGLVLIFIFLYSALRGKTNLKILYGFAAPVVMIGYPSFQSKKFDNEVVKVDKLVQAVNANPTDPTAQKELLNNLKELPASRCTTSVNAMTTIANAQVALGQYDSARVTIKGALRIDKSSPLALETQKDIEQKWTTQKEYEQRVTQISGYVNEWKSDKSKVYLRDSIAYQLQKLDEPIHLDAKKVLVIAEAADIINEPQAAEKMTDNVIKVNPANKDAVEMKENIRTSTNRNRIPSKTRPKPPVKTKPSTEDTKTKPQTTVPAPAPVYQDTANLRKSIRVLPKTALPIVKWKKD